MINANNICQKCFQYKFSGSRANVAPQRIKIGGILTATFHLDMSLEEVEYLKTKMPAMKIFCTKTNPFYKLLTKEITFRGATANIQYLKRTEHKSDSVHFADLSNWLVGQLDKKWERKIQRHCQENILAATISKNDEHVYIKSKAITTVKLRMPKNTRFRVSDYVTIKPFHKVKLTDSKLVKLKYDNKKHLILSCLVRVVNTGSGTIRLENGEAFGSVK